MLLTFLDVLSGSSRLQLAWTTFRFDDPRSAKESYSNTHADVLYRLHGCNISLMPAYDLRITTCAVHSDQEEQEATDR